jgi:hypothetical protein
MKKHIFFMGAFLAFAIFGSADFVETSGIGTESQVMSMEILGLAVSAFVLVYFVANVRAFFRETKF